MVNKKIILVMLLTSIATYGHTDYSERPYEDSAKGLTWGDTRTPRFRVPGGYEVETTNKLTAAYQNFLRFFDEENREKGIKTKYVKEHFGEVPEYNEDLNLVPVWVEKYNPGKELKGKTPKYFTKEEVNKIIKESNKHPKLLAAIPKDSINEKNNMEYRLYFGNGNQIENLVYETKESFKNTKTKKEVKHIVDGSYEIVSGKYNLFGLSEDEYKKYFLDANGNNVSETDPKLVEFVKSKLEEGKNIKKNGDGGFDFKGKIKIKDGELYIEENGKDRKIFHNTYRVSIAGTEGWGENKKNKFSNLALTKVVVFKPYQNGEEIVYTDNSIILKDVIDPIGSNFKIVEKKNLKEEIYKEKLSSDYIDLKNGKISEITFKNKWSLSKEDFQKDDFIKVLPKIYENDSIIKKFEANKDKLGYSLSSVCFPSWGNVNMEKFTAIYKGEAEDAKKFMREQNMSLAAFQKLIDDTRVLNEKINNEKIPNEIEKLKNKLSLKRISNENLLAMISGRKMVKFGGIGRINNLIDLGEGYNILMITENDGTYTGKFGTNITFSPNVQLRNIDVIGVGRQESATLGNSGLSGITSLNIEVDTNKVNKKGYLYQHALKDTWEPLDKKDENGNFVKPNRIVFRKAGEFGLEEKFRNDFVVQLNTSDIGKDGTIIDMGRPLTYRDDLDGYEYKLSLIPDTVVQDINVLPEKSESGNDLVEIKYKDSIKLLSDAENKIYKSMVDSGEMKALKETLTTKNKKTTFSSPEADKANMEKNMKLALALKDINKSADDIIRELPEVYINKQQISRLKELIQELKNDSDIKKYRGVSKTLEKYKKINVSIVENKLEKIRSEFNFIPTNIQDFFSKASFYGEEKTVEKQTNEKIKIRKEILRKFGSEANILAEIAKIKESYKENVEKLYEELKAAEPNFDKGEEEVGSFSCPGKFLRGNSYDSTPGILNLLKDGSGDAIDQLLSLISEIRVYSDQIKAFEKLNEEDNVNEKLLESLEKNGLFKQIRPLMFYTKRQAESIDEFKIILSQLYENNIYAKVNKISKNEIDTFTPIVFDNKYDFNSKKAEARGGAISGRFARDKFKGTVYSAYGMYEKAVQDRLSLGFIVGGANSKFHEIVNDDVKTITTKSKINGTSAYIGAFGRYDIRKTINWINGIGIQYGNYKVDRDMKNHYQQDIYKGKLDTYSGNIYSGITYDYKLNNTLDINVKGALSYTIVNQGKAKEDRKPLSIEVKAQNFNYLDGQLGVGLTKTIFGKDTISSLSGMVSGVYGISGYDNHNLKAKFVGSSYEFDVKGEKYDKVALKITLDYNMQQESGLSYGIEGAYIKNADEDNISLGVKAGYKF